MTENKPVFGVTPAFEQPEVPESVAKAIAAKETEEVALPVAADLATFGAEDDVYEGSEEDQLIGKEPDPAAIPKYTPEQIQALQIDALLKLTRSVEGIVNNQERIRQKTYAEILPTSPFNPEGKRNRTKLRGVFMQNGIPVNVLTMRESEIEAINSLKPGRYANRTIEVVRFSDGSLDIRMSNKTISQRMEHQGKYPTFPALVEALNAERALKEERRRKGWFDPEEEL